MPAGAVSEGTGSEEHFPQVSCDEEPTPSDTRIPWSKWGRILKERPVFTLDPLYHAGAYYVQDSSAQFVGHVFRKALAAEADSAQPAAWLNVLDLCAAPGGKTTDLAASLRERCGDRFLLVANEVGAIPASP